MSRPIPSEDLLADLRRVIAEHGKSDARTYQREGAYAMRSLVNRFGRWADAVAAASPAHAKTDPPPSTRDPEDWSDIRPALQAARGSDIASSRTIAIVSDIHFDLHDEATWYAFREWHAYVRPKHTVILGDFVDLGMLSKYEQGPDEPLFAVPQIQLFAREANALLRECDTLTVCMGNHDDRWAKALGAIKPYAFKGAVGLSLREQCELQGLEKSNRVQWFTEGKDGPALMVAGAALHHGHTKGGRWGGPKHLAASLLDKGNGQTQVVGHSHRGQLFFRGAFGRQSFGMSLPAMCRPMTYANDPDWQRGWGALSMLAPDYTEVVPHLLIAKQGRVAWGGKTFGVRVMGRAA